MRETVATRVAAPCTASSSGGDVVSMLALVRHGQTEWNRVGMFTGWSDEPLNELGRVHAKHAGVILAGIAEHWQVAWLHVGQSHSEQSHCAQESAQCAHLHLSHSS